MQDEDWNEYPRIASPHIPTPPLPYPHAAQDLPPMFSDFQAQGGNDAISLSPRSPGRRSSSSSSDHDNIKGSLASRSSTLVVNDADPICVGPGGDLAPPFGDGSHTSNVREYCTCGGKMCRSINSGHGRPSSGTQEGYRLSSIVSPSRPSK